MQQALLAGRVEAEDAQIGAVRFEVSEKPSDVRPPSTNALRSRSAHSTPRADSTPRRRSTTGHNARDRSRSFINDSPSRNSGASSRRDSDERSTSRSSAQRSKSSYDQLSASRSSTSRSKSASFLKVRVSSSPKVKTSRKSSGSSSKKNSRK